MIDTHSLSQSILSEISLPTAEPLAPSILIDKILGLIYGNALGDALGVRTEFLSSSDAKSIWQGQSFSLLGWSEPQRFPIADWTDDTDQMVLILQSYLETTTVNPLDFAKRLLSWRNSGFPELGDTKGLGMGYTVSRVISNKQFLKNPFSAALRVWTNKGCNLAANGALMRTSILGVINYGDLSQVIKQTCDIGMTTHADPRSLAACVAHTAAVALMLQGVDSDIAIGTAGNIARVFIERYTEALEGIVNKNCDEKAKEAFCANKNHFSREVLDRYLGCEFQDILPIDGEDLGYAYICLGCAFWAAKQAGWIESIGRIVLEGGDADTNAAASGAILGCKLGLGNLPQDLLAQLRHKDWLDSKISTLFSVMHLSEHSIL